jgi:hypothetical protein
LKAWPRGRLVGGISPELPDRGRFPIAARYLVAGRNAGYNDVSKIPLGGLSMGVSQ